MSYTPDGMTLPSSVQRHPRRGDRPEPERRDPHRPHRRGRRHDYDFAELDELTHAYAVTVHRAQGSEYPCVVIPVTTSAWMMLQRNLLYTAVTRAKKLVVLVGSAKAIGQAVRVTGAGRRHTALNHRLAERVTQRASRSG